MKKKLFITSIASILGIATLSTSIALYTSFEESLDIGISGSVVQDGNYTLTKNEVSENALTPDNPYKVSYALGFQPSDVTTYKQDTSVGNVSIKISTENIEDIQTIFSGLLINADITGYTEGTTFSAEFLDSERFNFTYNEAGYYIASNDVVFSNDGAQSLDIEILANKQTFINIAEKNINLEITLSDPVNYGFAYIVGSFNSWTQTDAYRMVPDLESKGGFMWKYEGLELKSGDVLKALKGETWSAGGDYTIQEDGIYNVTWNGGSDTGITVTKVQ